MRTSKHKNPVLAPVNKRRIRVLTALESQLIVKVKNDKQGKPVILSEGDTKRIEKEIGILKTRIKL